ncbi:hypothetical protein Dimus_004569 [Dionaea muscipula]
MVGLFICCISGFPRENEQEDEGLWSKRHSKEEEEENPFAARGLKQFCALLAEIEEKRQRIYSEVGAEAISLIQFVYSTDNKCKPIVVKAKKGEKEEEEEEVKAKEEEAAAAVIPLSAASDIHVAKEEKPTSSLTSLKVQQCYWLPLTFVMASLLLALFGRSAAILCASIVWYLVPNSSLLAQNESTSASASASMMKKKLDNGNRDQSIKKKMLAHRFCSFNMSPVKAKQHTRAIGRRLLRSHSMHA